MRLLEGPDLRHFIICYDEKLEKKRWKTKKRSALLESNLDIKIMRRVHDRGTTTSQFIFIEKSFFTCP